MRNIRMTIQYEGTKYQGWQKQTTSDNTIQGKLETLLSRMCGETIEISGSGRTDAGVHALAQIANFHTDSDMSLEEMLSYINRYLPEDIAVVQIGEAAPRFHSRLNAVSKTYRYLVVNSEIPNVFYRRYALEVPERLDIEAMRKAADSLCGEYDYKAFTSLKKSKKSTIRRVDRITIEENFEGQKGLISFTFEGNGFLHHMVRILVGTLLEVGAGERTADSCSALLSEGDRAKAGKLVPAKGLTLVEVKYD